MSLKDYLLCSARLYHRHFSIFFMWEILHPTGGDVHMVILGVSALYHDSAAALIVDGEIVAAAQEERFTRNKHDSGVPVNAIYYCLSCLSDYTGGNGHLDYVIFYDDPFLSLDRYLHNIVTVADDAEDLLGFGFEKMLGERLWIHELLAEVIPGLGNKVKFLVAKHHISHAASAFYPSPFKEAVIMTLDGVGEWTTLSIGVGHGSKMEILEEIRYPDSIGLFYSAFTYFCGFKVNSGDYKFMGLAPYGQPRYYDVIRDKVIKIHEDGSFHLNMDYFDYQHGRTMINEGKMSELFCGGRRLPETKITQREMDIAASVQLVVEEHIEKLARYAKAKYGQGIDNLVLAGGVALNCVANGRLLRTGIFKHLWIQPAAGDAGGALGAALYLYYHVLENPRQADGIHDHQQGSFLGPGFDNRTVREFLDAHGYPYQAVASEKLPKEVAGLLAKGLIIGLFHGRMEFGPRALGHRSIIADPRSPEMQARLNLKIKFRESFRPFAPSVLAERATDYFDLDSSSPYMLICADVRKERRLKFNVAQALSKFSLDMLPVVRTPRSDIPAVTHVDYSARVQTVDRERNSRYYDILKAFERQTGCGVVVNTSFNVRGEPIVCTPEDAYRCFMRTEMDALVLEDCILLKADQPDWCEIEDWRNKFELD